MNRFSPKCLALLLPVAALLSSCASKANLTMTVADAPGTVLAVQKIKAASSELVDSVKTDASGTFRCRIPVSKDAPEFVYVYRGDTRLAALLLESGDKAVVTADTLGNYSVSGSKGSEELCSVERDYAAFIRGMRSAESNSEASRLYVDYYRGRVRYVLEHPYSMSIVPVLYQNLGGEFNIFSNPSDAVLFRRAADSLKSVYPASPYVKALDREASQREQAMQLEMKLRNAEVRGFPDIVLPGTDGEKKSLAGVEAKAILVHFWNASDAAQTLFNQEVLLPIYKKYHRKGFEIYSVCLSTDKAQWASVVRNQDLPWVNVCDTRAASSPVIGLYNLQSLPSSILIADGSLSDAKVNDAAGLRAALDKVLR